SGIFFAVISEFDGSYGSFLIAGGHLQGVNGNAILKALFGFVSHELQQVVVFEFFLFIGQFQEPVVNLIKVNAVDGIPQALKVMLEGVTAAACRQNNFRLIDANVFGVDNFIV